jgi:hypothetical protein
MTSGRVDVMALLVDASAPAISRANQHLDPSPFRQDASDGGAHRCVVRPVKRQDSDPEPLQRVHPVHPPGTGVDAESVAGQFPCRLITDPGGFAGDDCYWLDHAGLPWNKLLWKKAPDAGNSNGRQLPH